MDEELREVIDEVSREWEQEKISRDLNKGDEISRENEFSRDLKKEESFGNNISLNIPSNISGESEFSRKMQQFGFSRELEDDEISLDDWSEISADLARDFIKDIISRESAASEMSRDNLKDEISRDGAEDAEFEDILNFLAL